MKRGLVFSLLAAVLLVAGLAAGPFSGGGNEGLGPADEARRNHTVQLMAVDGVVGVALGLNPAGRPSVLVLTAREGVRNIPREVDGVPVHVLVTGEINTRHHRGGHDGGPGNDDGGGDGGNGSDPAPGNECPTDTRKHHRPACIGMSTGHPDITAGTIGARVKDGDGNVFALSNNHVYANSNSASTLDNVLQPGPFDGGDPNNSDHVLGTLVDYEEIIFNNQACTDSASDLECNIMDAAIAGSSGGGLGNATPPDGYGTPNSTAALARINQRVMKYGRTTGQTDGRVWAINATVNVNYGEDNGIATFVNQIVIRGGGFSAGGDSGSLIVTQNGKNPVGLLFAGSVNTTIANPIGPVLDRFQVTVDGN